MNKWFLSAEIFSLIIIVILMLNFYERRWKNFEQRKIYQLCFLMSAGSILLNIICVHTIARAWDMPLWVNLFFNSAYFLLIMTVSTIIAYYLMYLLFEHIYLRSGLKKFKKLLTLLYFMSVIFCFFCIMCRAEFYFTLMETGFTEGVLLLIADMGLWGFSCLCWLSLPFAIKRVSVIL